MKTLSHILIRWPYALLAATITTLIVVGVLLFPNLELLGYMWTLEAISFSDFMRFAVSLLGSLTTNHTLFGSFVIVGLALLFGIYISVLVYYLRTMRSGRFSFDMASIGGMVSGLLGIGCAACGTLVVTSVLGTVGLSGLILILPAHGLEFGLLGIGLLLFGIGRLIKRITGPKVC